MSFLLMLHVSLHISECFPEQVSKWLVLEFDSGHGTEELRRFKSQDSSGKFTIVKLLWYRIYIVKRRVSYDKMSGDKE